MKTPIVSTDNLEEINRYRTVLLDAIEELRRLIASQQYESAYDLVDAIHCLPDALMRRNRWDAQYFWQDYIKPYREKWRNDFLCEHEKALLG